MTFIVNPFRSEAQRRWMFSQHPAMAKRWAAHTPKGKNLPSRVTKGSRARKGKRTTGTTNNATALYVANARKKLLRYDPSRTASIRRAWAAELRARFARLRKLVVDLIAKEDALGLTRNASVSTGFYANAFDPDEARDEHGRWTGGGSQPKHAETFDAAVDKLADDLEGLGKDARAAAKFLTSKTDELIGKLVDRYGGPGAMAVLASGQAVGWGATIVGTVLTGVPVWLPGSTVWGAVPGMLVAEGIKRLAGLFKRGGTTNAAAPSDAVKQLVRDVAAIVAEARRKWGDGNGVHNVRWEFHTSSAKVQAFQAWLATQVQQEITGRSEDELWRRYVQQGYAKGQGRAFSDVRRAERAQSHGDPAREAWYAGGEEQFLRSSFGHPVSVEKVKLLAGRTYNDLKGVTDQMSARMTRVLTDGLVEGQSPREVAKTLAREVDLGRSRALLISRTETIRAHAEGQLDALNRLGVRAVGVEVEFSATGDGLVCPECEDLDGVVYDLDEARGVIPVHPNCRCAWVPAVPV